MDYLELDKKWQQKWNEAHIFESEPSDKEQYMVTVAFPYVNGPQHIGHMRTFGTADVLARYKRMNNFNVLFPMGFHATGTPILAFAKRIQNKDTDLIADLKLFHIPDQDIEKMTDPIYIANYFVREIENGMHRAGYSIDWRRKFISIDPFFSKFVEWQFGILNEKGYLIKGRHPVGWCTNENNAVGMHDTKHDVEPDIEKEVAIKFKVDGEDAYMLCATYRPETVFGVTNLFIGESHTYVLCKIYEDKLYVEKKASELLKYQFPIEAMGEVSGSEMLKKRCINPVTGSNIPVLDGFFVKDGIGTGIVMSVPAHAPFDYEALQRLKAEGKCTEIKPIRVLEIPKGVNSEYSKSIENESYIDAPSIAYINMFKGTGSIYSALESATKLQYKEESRYGRMVIDGYMGMSEPDARIKVTEILVSKNNAMDIYTLTNAPVFCRCGHEIVIKVVDNQWFLNYGNPEWKRTAKESFKKIKILPEKSRKAFEAAIDWIDLRAVARSQGLGTRFPLNKDYIIESLSDSTLYMSFYTISNSIRDIDPEKLKPEFFDYVYMKKGDAEMVAEATGMDYKIIKKCRESFDYWYRTTSRHSGPDLIFNHLTMYIFNHSTIFQKEYWPKQIVVNGSVLSEGEKMSKSLGNIVPLVDALDKYGADVVRTLVVAGADLFSDSEFSEDAAKGIDERFRYLYEIAGKIDTFETGELTHMDYWLYSKLNRKIKAATEQTEMLELRGVSTNVIYDSVLELKRYFTRGKPNGIVLKDFMSAVVLLMSPIAPHISEEMWHMLGHDSFASIEKWPQVDELMISNKVESEEERVDSIISDSKQVISLIKKKGKEPKIIKLIVADNWKRELNNELLRTKNVNEIMKKLNDSETRKKLGIKDESRENAIKYVQSLAKRLNEIQKSESSQDDDYAIIYESRDYIGSLLKCKVEVEKESESKSERAANATPHRPSIDIFTV